jgi:ribosomal protein S18 acetylase RimI-like enzyme
VTLTLVALPAEEYAEWRAGLLARRAAGPRMRGLDPDEALARAASNNAAILPEAGPAASTEPLTVVDGAERRGTLVLFWPTATGAQVGDLVLDPADAVQVRELVMERAAAGGAESLSIAVLGSEPATTGFVAGQHYEVFATQMQLDLGVRRPDDRASRVVGRPMTGEEVATYIATAVERFAAETRAADRLLGQEDALESSRRLHELLLPQGAETPGHDFLVAEDALDGRRVGHAWLFHESRAGFVYDVEVDEAERGRGYGRALMDLAAGHCRTLGLEVLGLNVFGHNEVARGLYDALGYVVIDEAVRLRLSPR